MSVQERLRELDITLVAPPRAAASYVTARRDGRHLYLSGHVSRGTVGRVGDDVTAEQATGAARAVAIELLSTADAALGSLDAVRGVVKLTGFIRSAPGFSGQPAVMNGASDIFVAVFGDSGRHARSAIGVAELPLGVAVEIEAILEVDPEAAGA